LSTIHKLDIVVLEMVELMVLAAMMHDHMYPFVSLCIVMVATMK